MADIVCGYYKNLRAGGISYEQAMAETDAIEIVVKSLNIQIEQIKKELKEFKEELGRIK